MWLLQLNYLRLKHGYNKFLNVMFVRMKRAHVGIFSTLRLFTLTYNKLLQALFTYTTSIL